MMTRLVNLVPFSVSIALAAKLIAIRTCCAFADPRTALRTTLRLFEVHDSWARR